VSNRLGSAPIAGALAVLAWAACASGTIEPVVDLTPFVWTWSQVSLGDTVIRYGFPEEPAATGDAADAAPFALVPVGPGASETRLASYRYDCAATGREPAAGCTVFLDFWLLELEPPLAEVTLPAHRARLEGVYGDAPPRRSASDLVRDAHGREWYRRRIGFASGAAFSHYSRPIDAGRALAVTSYTTRAPDRIAARDLARDAIDRAVIAAEHPGGA